MQSPEFQDVAILTGTLLGFDIKTSKPNGQIDSTGIFQKWYGKWYDRLQGSVTSKTLLQTTSESVPAVCGALMFCRALALRAVLIGGKEVFDETFFMYKEDIDLSLRLIRKGWRLIYLADLHCYHCRGWKSRKHMPRYFRYLSARNELRICPKNRWRGLVYSLCKFIFVGFFYISTRKSNADLVRH